MRDIPRKSMRAAARGHTIHIYIYIYLYEIHIHVYAPANSCISSSPPRSGLHFPMLEAFRVCRVVSFQRRSA